MVKVTFTLDDQTGVLLQLVGSQRRQPEADAARADRRQQFAWITRQQKQVGEVRWLFQRLEQRIGRLIGAVLQDHAIGFAEEQIHILSVSTEGLISFSSLPAALPTTMSAWIQVREIASRISQRGGEVIDLGRWECLAISQIPSNIRLASDSL